MNSSNKSQFRPKHPIMVWDGDCEFCRLCADRFKSAGTNSVEFIPFQNLHRKYPKAPRLDYKKSVVLFSDKDILSGAAAINAYYSEIGVHWPLMLYKRLNIFSKSLQVWVFGNRWWTLTCEVKSQRTRFKTREHYFRTRNVWDSRLCLLCGGSF